MNLKKAFLISLVFAYVASAAFSIDSNDNLVGFTLTNAVRLNQVRFQSIFNFKLGCAQFNSMQPLSWNDLLSSSSQFKTKEIGSGCVGHNSCFNCGTNCAFGARIYNQFGYKGEIAENIAYAGTAQQKIIQWLSDQPHCQNIMNSNMHEIGMSFIENGPATQDFGGNIPMKSDGHILSASHINVGGVNYFVLIPNNGVNLGKVRAVFGEDVANSSSNFRDLQYSGFYETTVPSIGVCTPYYFEVFTNQNDRLARWPARGVIYANCQTPYNADVTEPSWPAPASHISGTKTYSSENQTKTSTPSQSSTPPNTIKPPSFQPASESSKNSNSSATNIKIGVAVCAFALFAAAFVILRQAKEEGH